MTILYALVGIFATLVAIGAFFRVWTRLHRWFPAVFSVAVIACGSGASAPLPPCATADDCARYLDAGPCGFVACDPFGLVGEPEVHGAPKGCYVAPKGGC